LQAAGEAFFVGGDEDLVDSAGLGRADEGLGDAGAEYWIKVFEGFVQPQGGCVGRGGSEHHAGDEQRRCSFAAAEVGQGEVDVGMPEVQLPVGG
jgi:hypothetical protein